ncbi:MAG: YbaB/EbfC family nucleoid-associated protein [Spirochaetaceae bacterium]|jgi:DNA-binding YbaB/EbfC family protein|nr:YbaB/EbfC family nucleoid-associated protein [Spirochaetaceae bacterium]
MDINSLDLMKSAQKLQDKMGEFKNRIGDIVVTGSAGGGMVEIEMNGRQEMTAVNIDPEVAGDVEMLQDLIIAAYNSAVEKSREAVKNEEGAFSSIFNGVIPENFFSNLKF